MSYDDATVELEEQIKQQAAVIEQMREASLFFIGWAERNAMWDKCDSSYYLAKKASALQPCPKVLNKVRADAERYRWLRENLNNTEALEELYKHPGDIPTAEQFDEAIDDAIAKEKTE